MERDRRLIGQSNLEHGQSNVAFVYASALGVLLVAYASFITIGMVAFRTDPEENKNLLNPSPTPTPTPTRSIDSFENSFNSDQVVPVPEP